MMPNPSIGSLAPVQQAGARTLPAKPNLEHLKNEAKQRLDKLRATTPRAKLAEAQHQLAREYGFANWRDLKADVDARSSGSLSSVARAAIGDWIGELPGDGRIALHIRLADGGGLAATMDSRDFGFFGLAADDVAIEGQRLSFALVAPMVSGSHQGLYEARWDGERDRWIGEWTGHGITMPLDFVRGVYPPAPRFEGLDGFWDGRLKTKDGPIRLIVRFKTDEHGTFAWMDSPDRGLIGRPAVSVSREGRKVAVVMKTLTVVGDLSQDGQRIEGRLVKGKAVLPLILLHRPPGAAPPLPQRAPAIDLPSELLATYVGRYEIAPGMVMTLTLEDGRLWVEQTPGGLKLDLLAFSPTKFFYRIVDSSVDFEVADNGQVAGLVIGQNGRETRARRLA